MTRQTTDKIVIHCAATPPSMDIGADEIRKWHVDGNGWSDIGYHYVIRRDGTIELGRDRDRIGAHAAGHNGDSVAICLVGGVDENQNPENNFTAAQLDSLELAVNGLLAFYPRAEVLGHRDLPGVTKACPSFDAKAWWRDKQ